MAIRINKTPTKGYKYIFTSERDIENPFTVWIKPLQTRDLLDLEDRMVQRQGEDVFIAQGVFSFRVAQQGILAWENINDEKDKALKLSITDGLADEDSIANIPADLITEVSSVINAITRDPASIQIFFPEE